MTVTRAREIVLRERAAWQIASANVAALLASPDPIKVSKSIERAAEEGRAWGRYMLAVELLDEASGVVRS